MPKVSAVAHPIQGLIKYHGLKDPVRRIPYHDSISVCTAPLTTHTTFEPCGEDQNVAVIDGETVTGRPLQRIEAVVDAIREHASDERCWRMESRNDFPQFVGLGSSSSGFAALAVAAAGAYGFDAPLERISEFARIGAGSACRAVTGGVSEWVNEGARSFSRCIMDADAIDWRIVVPVVDHLEPTEGVHEEVTTSPLFDARVAYVPDACQAMHAAIQQRSLAAIAALAEADTMNLHAVTMTGQNLHLTWQPTTVAVMRKVRALRQADVPVWFSIDTGATAYLNTDSAHEDAVAEAVASIDGVVDVLRLQPGGPARRIDDHLF